VRTVRHVRQELTASRALRVQKDGKTATTRAHAMSARQVSSRLEPRTLCVRHVKLGSLLRQKEQRRVLPAQKDGKTAMIRALAMSV